LSIFTDSGNTVEGLIYTYSTRVSVPSSELAPPPPLPQASVSPPWNQWGGGGATLACGEREGGANSDDWRESLHGILYTLWENTIIAYVVIKLTLQRAFLLA
jgi:hypothetical protein